jgi:chitinase
MKLKRTIRRASELQGQSEQSPGTVADVLGGVEAPVHGRRLPIARAGIDGLRDAVLNGETDASGWNVPASEPPWRRERAAGLRRLTVAGLVAGLATTGLAVLPTEIAAAATSSPTISAQADMVVGEASGSVSPTVTLSAPSTNTVSVNWSVPVGGCNYALSGTGSGTLTFAPGVTSKAIPLTVNQCNLNGLNSATLTLSSPTNATIAHPDTVIDVVGDNNLQAVPGLYTRGTTVDTSAGSVQIPVMLGGPDGATSASSVTVNYTTVNGTAVAGTDYTATSNTLTFGPGQTEQTITVPITDRTTAAASRSFTVVLSSPTNAAIVQSTATVIIGASGGTNVSSPTVSAPPNTVIGEADGWVDLPVTLSAPSTNTVSVNWSVGVGGCNYALSGIGSGTLTFVPGQVVQDVRMQVNQCNFNQLNAANLVLSSATNATIAHPDTVIDVVGDNNLQAVPGLYTRGTTVDTSAGSVQIPVMLGGPDGATSASSVTVNYTTVNGTAVAGTDYTATSNTLTFGPGQTEQTITVPITDRTTAAASRSFTVVLSSPTNAAIVQSTATVIIGASGGTNVSSPTVSAPPNTVIGEADGWVDLPVTLSAPSTNTVSVNWSVGVGGCNYALSGIGSGTLTFVPGQVVQDVRMQVNQCNVTSDLTATLTLSSATNATIGTATTLITVTPPPTAPGAPTGVTAVAGAGSATVSFTPPASDGGDPVTSYTVTASPGGATVSGASSPLTVTGLTAGTSYTFTVTATNPEGTSSASAPSNAVVPTAGSGFAISIPTLPTANPGQAFGPVTLHVSGEGTSAAGYTTTLKWAKVTLPKGLKLSATGVLSGTPSKALAAGPSSVVVKVTETVTTLSGTKKVKTKTTVQATIPLTIG